MRFYPICGGSVRHNNIIAQLLNIFSFLSPESWHSELFSGQCQAEARGLVIREHGNEASTYFCLWSMRQGSVRAYLSSRWMPKSCESGRPFGNSSQSGSSLGGLPSPPLSPFVQRKLLPGMPRAWTQLALEPVRSQMAYKPLLSQQILLGKLLLAQERAKGTRCKAVNLQLIWGARAPTF